MEWITDKLANYASVLDPKTKDQAIESSSIDIIYPHLALMPDAHLGKGATVGSVIPTVGSIIPAAVGVDIGCGMMAVLTQWSKVDLEDVDLQALHASISNAIPLSAGKYNQSVRYSHTRERVSELEHLAGVKQAVEVTKGKMGWERQLGSLGSGNHFIEISLDELDRVWLFLHSGSRGVGNRLAQEHIKVAQAVCTEKLPNRDLAYLTAGTPEFVAYMEALNWAQRFAWLNRAEMMDRVKSAMTHYMGETVVEQQEINCHHNYTEKTNVLDKTGKLLIDVYLSRKGAIDASAGVSGLIPGSMGTASYIVTGLGDPVSFWSSPHGAGRMFSRGAAKRQFTYDELEKSMEGVAWGNSGAFIDEIAGAYKDIDVVMKDSATLVIAAHVLRQLVNVKGD